MRALIWPVRTLGRGLRAAGRAFNRRPVLKAITIFVLVMGAYYAIDFTPFLSSRFLEWYLEMLARTSANLISALGHQADSIGVRIESSAFSVKIVRGCDALEPSAAFIAAVLASPVALRFKLPGIVVGTVCLLLINLVRIVSLFFIGIHARSIFDLMHYDLWQAAFIVLAIAFWAVWVQWATRRGKRGGEVC